ncbi:MAG: DEAD/DEAH box helicase [Patescibacteria group bacterium]
MKFLYVAPERLNSADFSRVLQKTPISLIAIDEAHCISQWGHDFRPSYMKIKGFIENLRSNHHFPVIALTATATKKVREDIVGRIGLKDFNTFTK